jgi:ABC-type uncharacterized transport system involved in gliding motility auxiliary subunit
MSNLSKLIGAFVALFIVVALSSVMLTGVRIDLSENGLYTLSDGSKSILSKLENEVTIDFYFSEKATTQLPALRTYAQRVNELLLEYESYSAGKLNVQKIDPEPFSEAEDAAALAGIQAIPGGAQGDDIYFGLVAKNNAGLEEVIPFLQPNKEVFLEYDLTRLISSLAREAAPRIAIYSGLGIKGGMDYMRRQQTPEWSILQFMEDGFELVWIDDNAAVIEDVELFVLIGPQTLSAPLKLAIDQYVLQGGKLIAFVDPYMETMAQSSGMPSVQRSDLPALLNAWGVRLQDDMFLTDFDNSMVVSMGASRNPVRHVGLLNFGPDAMASDDVVLFGLETLTLSSAGILEKLEGATTKLEPMLISSKNSQPRAVDLLTSLHDPQSLLNGFEAQERQYTMAMRVSGPASTAFPDGVMPEPAAESDATVVGSELGDTSLSDELLQPLMPALTQADDIQVMVVADTDLLSDRLWVQVQEFYGQRIVTPWADNGSFLVNSLENMTGQPELISIRSQGRFNRPFDRVDALRRDAETRFLAQQERLEEELQSTESKLMALESVRNEGEGALFSPEQETELLKFQEEKLKIRKQLRDVQHQLDKDIETLGTQLKLINILLIPALICLLALGFVARRKFMRT